MASHHYVNSDSEDSRSHRGSPTDSDSKIVCYHGETSPLINIRTEASTKGRSFYGCSHLPQTCGFQKWVNVTDEVGELQHDVFAKEARIGELEIDNHVLRRKLRKIRHKRADLEDDVEELAIANTESMLEMKNHISDKKLFVLTFVFFALVLLLVYFK